MPTNNLLLLFLLLLLLLDKSTVPSPNERVIERKW